MIVISVASYFYNGDDTFVRGEKFEIKKYYCTGKTQQPLLDSLSHIMTLDDHQMLVNSWRLPMVLLRHSAKWRWNSRYSNIYTVGDSMLLRRGQQMNGLGFVSLVKFREYADGYIEDTTQIPDSLVVKSKIPILPMVDVQVEGPLEIMVERKTRTITETVCKGMCTKCNSIVFVKNVVVWGQQHVVSSGCTCGGVDIVPCNEEAGYMEVRNRCFGRLKHKRNRDPCEKLPIPWVEYQVTDVPITLKSKEVYVDTEGIPTSLWQIFDLDSGKVYITNFQDTFNTMVKGKTIYTWGGEPGVKSINLQVRDEGYLLSLKSAMELIGYTLDKRYTLSDWEHKISNCVTSGEERYKKEAYAYAARDALAVYLWRVCKAFVPITKPQYVLDTEYNPYD